MSTPDAPSLRRFAELVAARTSNHDVAQREALGASAAGAVIERSVVHRPTPPKEN